MDYTPLSRFQANPVKFNIQRSCIPAFMLVRRPSSPSRYNTIQSLEIPYLGLIQTIGDPPRLVPHTLNGKLPVHAA